MSTLGGICRGSEHIFITHIPGLKNPCLCICNGNVIQKLASFDSEEYAEDFYKMLCEWFGLKAEGEE